MHFRSKSKNHRKAATLAAAITAAGFTTIAGAATTNSSAAFEGAQVEPAVSGGGGGPYLDGSGDYLQLNGSGNAYPTYGVLDFSVGSSALGLSGQAVTAVNSDLDLTMYFDSYSKNTTSAVTLTFYIATDTNTAEVQTTAGTPLISYQTGSALGGGLNSPGGTGSFASGTQLYNIGTQTYNPTGLSGATPINYGFTLNTTEENYILQQIQNNGNVRIVATTSETDTREANFYGYNATPANTFGTSGTGYAPTLGLDLTTTSVVSNSSLLYAGTSGTSKTASVTVGRYLTDHGAGQYTVLQGVTSNEVAPDATSSFAPSTVTLYNGTTTPGDNLNYTVPVTAANSVTPGPDPLAPGASGQATLGFQASDTSNLAGGNQTITLNVANNSNLSDAPVKVTVTTGLILAERYVDSANGTSAPAPNIGKVLVGATGSVATTITTVDPVAFDYGNDVLTTETLLANSTATPFTLDDFFTKNGVGVMNAVGPSTNVTFDNQESANVTAQVTVLVSGQYGNNTAGVEGGVTQNYAPNYAAFGQTDIQGDNLQGEKDSMDVYMQWTGYQAASVTAGTASGSLGSGNTGSVSATLTNAVSNDNNYTNNSTTYVNGLRAAAWVTGVSLNSTDWSQNGFTPVTVSGSGASSSVTSGTTLAYTQGTVSTASATLSFPTTNKLNGTYGANMIVTLENEQDIQGTSANDLPAQAFILSATVTDKPTIESGTYTLNGGTFIDPVAGTDLTGTFTENSGTATFHTISGSGSINITGGTTTLVTNGTHSTIGSLAISGSGTLDIGNNSLYINYVSGQDPISSIFAMIKSGFSGGSWAGAGIVSSLAKSLPANYTIGYADSADLNNPAGLGSNQIEIKATLLGDANLDGKVNGTDFLLMAANFNDAVTNGWDEGDFDYSGAVNGTDFVDLAGEFNQFANQASPSDIAALDAFAAANGISLASVPEPASLGLLALGVTAALARRRRKSTGN